MSKHVEEPQTAVSPLLGLISGVLMDVLLHFSHSFLVISSLLILVPLIHWFWGRVGNAWCKRVKYPYCWSDVIHVSCIYESCNAQTYSCADAIYTCGLSCFLHERLITRTTLKAKLTLWFCVHTPRAMSNHIRRPCSIPGHWYTDIMYGQRCNCMTTHMKVTYKVLTAARSSDQWRIWRVWVVASSSSSNWITSCNRFPLVAVASYVQLDNSVFSYNLAV